MADKTVRGRFVWHELITPEAAGAHAFYAKALGWKTQTWELDPSYTMFVAASGPLGGSVQRPSEPARWLPYLGTEHIEGTVDQARSLGARVLTDVTVMPSGGKYAVLEDPQGVAFGVYTSATDPEPEGTPKLGEFSWHELATDDFRAAFEFYSALFGWEAVAEHDMGAPLGTYFIFGRGDVQMGGMFKRMPEMPSAAWLGYVRVKDIDQTIKKAASAGGTVVLEPMEVPGGDWVVQFNDPQGGTFAVHMLAADLKRAETPAAPPAPAEAEAVETESTEEQAAAAGAARRTAGGKAASKQATKKVAKKAAKKAARKAAKKAARKAVRKSAGAKKIAKKKAGSKKRAGAKKKAAKKAAPRGAARGAAKRRTSAKKSGRGAGAKRPARKVARGAKAKKTAKKRAGAQKRSAKARKAK